jgi:DNA-directed RNA polymerase subunit RPC12/RpoP
LEASLLPILIAYKVLIFSRRYLMSIQFVCPNCGARLAVQQSLAGQKANCPECGTETVVPGPLPSDHHMMPGYERAVNPPVEAAHKHPGTAVALVLAVIALACSLILLGTVVLSQAGPAAAQERLLRLEKRLAALEADTIQRESQAMNLQVHMETAERNIGIIARKQDLNAKNIDILFENERRAMAASQAIGALLEAQKANSEVMKESVKQLGEYMKESEKTIRSLLK